MYSIVTRAREDIKATSSLFSEAGLTTIELPCLEFQEPDDNYEALDKAIRSNHEYDWVIFLSKKSAEVFFDRLLAIGGHLFNLATHLKFACVGAKTKDFVENEIGFPVHFIPSKFNSETFVEEFIPCLKRFNAKGQSFLGRIMLPRTDVADESFEINLKAAISKEFAFQAQVTLCPAYKSACPDIKSLKKELQLIKDLIDKDETINLVFTSSQIVRNFKKIIESSSIELKRDLLRVYSIGPKTSITIKDLFGEDLQLYEPKEATIKALASMIK